MWNRTLTESIIYNIKLLAILSYLYRMMYGSVLQEETCKTHCDCKTNQAWHSSAVGATSLLGRCVHFVIRDHQIGRQIAGHTRGRLGLRVLQIGDRDRDWPLGVVGHPSSFHQD